MATTVGPFVAAVDPTHEDCLSEQKLRRLRALVPFYTPARLRDLVVPFLRDEGVVSLRHLNHLVNHMAAAKGIAWTMPDNTVVHLRDTYRAWLSAWTRRLFDPFRRYERVYFRSDDDDEWQATTVGQLNFFFFAERFGVLTFARAHRDAIDADMRGWNRKQREARRRNAPRPVAPPAATGMHTHVGPATVQF